MCYKWQSLLLDLAPLMSCLSLTLRLRLTLWAFIPTSDYTTCCLGSVPTSLFKSCSPILSQFISTCINKSLTDSRVAHCLLNSSCKFNPWETYPQSRFSLRLHKPIPISLLPTSMLQHAARVTDVQK